MEVAHVCVLCEGVHNGVSLCVKVGGGGGGVVSKGPGKGVGHALFKYSQYDICGACK